MTPRQATIGWGIGGVVVVAALGLGARAATGVLVSASDDIPTGTVTRGTLKADLITTGEIKATKTDILAVPPTGAALRILTLLPAGTRVKKGDTVVTFDPTDQEKTVEEQRSVLREAQLEIARTLATTAARQAQDDLDLQTARFDLRKAELDVQASEVQRAARGAQGAADARGGAQPAGAAGGRSHLALAVRPGRARRRAREGDQGAARDPGGDHDPVADGAEGVDGRRRVGEGQPEHQLRLSGDDPERVPRRRPGAGRRGRSPKCSTSASSRSAPTSTRTIAPAWRSARRRR